MRTGPARGRTGNVHEAGFYGSDAEFLSLIVPFVADAAAAGEPVVLGYDARKSDLLRAALPRLDPAAFLGDASLYATPAGAIEAYRRQFEQHVAAGAEQIRIAGDVPHEGNGGRFAGWDRYESAVNAVWEDYPVWSRCLYDSTTVSDDVRDVVERTHRNLVAPDGSAAASPRYQEVPDFRALPPPVDPLEATAPAVSLVDASLKNTRRRVAAAARGRIDAGASDDLLFALSEAVINAQLHGRPPVSVQVWTASDRVVTRVHDIGPGPAGPLTGLVPAPDGTSGAGLGLWLSHQRAGVELALTTDDAGFAVRLRAGRLPDPARTPVGTIPIRAGTAWGTPPDRDGVHAIDGDDSSFCEVVGATQMIPLDDVLWSDVPAAQRCPACRLLVTLDIGLEDL
ncbi:sensor histidine kinase [Petropleomorpha daqingensis]|uniref:Anti-sigma regulatory factor (Ser/Thr protein kinase) n=1 Tax=Petropleomorpha daqingensis TaxID=2026353 RepID=A0A853CHP0_9ACTN|nr:sensor histidine kinase [Petropleomorpha daqingensis]NYJ06997.1 anti-sigma regulatory factor (Ser/Thr protein kinase) [Petropleomorpha daqingensis]